MLTGDTKIQSLYDRDDEINCYVGRKNFDILSCTLEGHIIASNGNSANLIKYVNRIYKIMLSNNRYVKCTTGHPWMMRDGTFKKAYELKIGDSLMPFEKLSSFLKGAHDHWSEIRQNDDKSIYYLTSEGEFYKDYKNIGNYEYSVTVKSINLIQVDNEPVYKISINKYNKLALSAGVFVRS